MEKSELKILFMGDIVGRPGRNSVKNYLPKLKQDNNIDYIFANIENLASGKGVTHAKYLEMLDCGIDYFTSGNHIWNNKEIIPYMERGEVKILRPYNYHVGSVGKGYVELDDLILLNLQGRVFMPDEVSDPFTSALNIINKSNKPVIIDFHAEATSEKIALGYYLDGKVAALVGTHTHVQTADEKILAKGSAYISDIGMIGPYDSVLGVKKEIIIEKFLTQQPKSHKVASGDTIFNAVLITINKATKTATEIKRINQLIKN